MDLSSKKLAELIGGMRQAYEHGENTMAFARNILNSAGELGRNQRIATLVAYDLQAGSYMDAARRNPEANKHWCRQIAKLIDPELPHGGSLLELGVGEATTLAGVLKELVGGGVKAYGFDISWSRIKVAKEWLGELSESAELCVADLLNIPFADNSIDVVYSSHSLEPNGGKEQIALAECLRVARKAVVLVEPLYELASSEAQARMRQHGYIRGLRETAESLGAEVVDYRLLEYATNPLNPSGVLKIRKVGGETAAEGKNLGIWQCPLTGSRLTRMESGFFAPDVGIVYPILTDIPLLRVEHAVIASKFIA